MPAEIASQPSSTDGTDHRFGAPPRVRMTAPLTRREVAVLWLLPTQLSTREISHELHVSVNTVRSEVRAVYRKLDTTSRSAAVARARQLGLLPTSHEPVATSPR